MMQLTSHQVSEPEAGGPIVHDGGPGGTSDDTESFESGSRGEDDELSDGSYSDDSDDMSFGGAMCTRCGRDNHTVHSCYATWHVGGFRL